MLFNVILIYILLVFFVKSSVFVYDENKVVWAVITNNML